MNDDELLTRLRAADPAASTSAPAPDIHRLMEAAMTTKHTSRTSSAIISMTGDRSSNRRRRSLLSVVAVVSLLVGGGATWVAVNDHGQASGQQRTDLPMALTLETGGGAKCIEPTADLLRKFDVAFEGTVTSRNADQVVFRIDHWFRGGDASTVQLSSDGADGGSESLTFQAGQSYLVTAQDGVVPVCGGTDLTSAEGQALFERAFGR